MFARHLLRTGEVGNRPVMADIGAHRVERAPHAARQRSWAGPGVTAVSANAAVTVRVDDVAPDGTSTGMTTGWQTASLRATDPKRAAPGTIRADLAQSIEANVVHGSDAADTAACEIAFFFSGTDLCPRS